jgi:hypothetical protein
MRIGLITAAATVLCLMSVAIAQTPGPGKDPNTKQMVADIQGLLDGPMAQAVSAERLILVSSKP